MIKALDFEEAFINRNHILSSKAFLSLLNNKMLISLVHYHQNTSLMVQCWRSP